MLCNSCETKGRWQKEHFISKETKLFIYGKYLSWWSRNVSGKILFWRFSIILYLYCMKHVILQNLQVFPYPYTLNEEQHETISMFVDPFTKFFTVSRLFFVWVLITAYHNKYFFELIGNQRPCQKWWNSKYRSKNIRCYVGDWWIRLSSTFR